MLHEPMNRLLTPLVFLIAAMGHGQVVIDMPLELTGPEEQRMIEGLGDPLQDDALMARSAHLRGLPHWTEASSVTGGLSLTGAGGGSSFEDGSLLRFLSPGNAFGPLTVRVNNGTPIPLVRPDGLSLVQGDLVTGAVGEIMAMDGRWVLMSPNSPDCPPGSIAVNDRYCIDIAQSSNTMIFYAAMDHCASRGGRLCKWDEYYHACSTLGPQLTGLFNDWEWIDDTSNHVHIGDQAGRTTCMSQRSETISFIYPARCCYTRP
jgi:hypothetical protein